jgi:hypothetical protein
VGGVRDIMDSASSEISGPKSDRKHLKVPKAGIFWEVKKLQRKRGNMLDFLCLSLKFSSQYI